MCFASLSADVLLSFCPSFLALLTLRSSIPTKGVPPKRGIHSATGSGLGEISSGASASFGCRRICDWVSTRDSVLGYGWAFRDTGSCCLVMRQLQRYNRIRCFHGCTTQRGQTIVLLQLTCIESRVCCFSKSLAGVGASRLSIAWTGAI
jgi:hypothetical protein